MRVRGSHGGRAEATGQVAPAVRKKTDDVGVPSASPFLFPWNVQRGINSHADAVLGTSILLVSKRTWKRPSKKDKETLAGAVKPSVDLTPFCSTLRIC